jgi:uncharacterized protein (DUF608 family)
MNPTPGIPTYDASCTEVAFPLGGIGTGNVSLGARGDLRDWEIFNRPAKGTLLPNTFFAIRLQPEGGTPVTRVLEGRVQPPFTKSHGFDPQTGAGLPRFATSTFRGEYPFARITFEDPDVPVKVELEAYTPLVPLNPQDSGIPCAILTYNVQNLGTDTLGLTLVGSLFNAVGHPLFEPTTNKRSQSIGQTVNEYREAEALRGLYLRAEGIEAGALEYGTMSLVTDHANVTYKRAWLRGAWWDFLREFWDDLEGDGLLTDLGYTEPGNQPDTGSLGLFDRLLAGTSRSYRFILTWHFPNRINSWDVKPERIIRNHYAVRFTDAWDVARYSISELPHLDSATRQFHDALFGTTLPPYILDAVSANIVPVRSNTCFWLEDGRFYGWEGCFDNAGCCAGSCTHVWSYVYTVAYLFPSLEREMRRIEFQIETEPDGYMSFRTFKSLEPEREWIWQGDKIAAVDGQMGSIIRAYREWQLSADLDWLLSIWPGIKSAINYAGIEWDRDGDFVLEGRQHNTYDIEFYGPNPLCSIYYLAALRAVEELAGVMNEPELALRCRSAFERGSQKLDALLWNGEYYAQVMDDIDAYKYQHGAGILSDQLLGQLHARILGLGDLIPPEHVRTAVKAIFNHNFRHGFDKHVNVQRTYVLNDESGLILCTWPRGGRPRFPFVYSDEVWTGIEYHVAAHLIYEGWLDEGLTIVESARARHDGIRRNPWNEVECGHHYARSMSSWMLLLALSGVHCDLGRGELSFEPVLPASTLPDTFSTIWSTGRAWGTYTQRRDSETGAWQPTLDVLGGDATGLRVRACGQEWTVHPS